MKTFFIQLRNIANRFVILLCLFTMVAGFWHLFFGHPNSNDSTVFIVSALVMYGFWHLVVFGLQKPRF